MRTVSFIDRWRGSGSAEKIKCGGFTPLLAEAGAGGRLVADCGVWHHMRVSVHEVDPTALVVNLDNIANLSLLIFFWKS